MNLHHKRRRAHISDRLPPTGNYCKCPQCCEMVHRSKLEQHKCSPIYDLDANHASSLSLAYLRGIQRESDLKRMKEHEKAMKLEAKHD